MDLATAVGRLEAAGTEQNRTVYRRHGARDPLWGVSFAVLDRLATMPKFVRDYVIVHVGYALAKLDPAEAARTLKLFAETGQAA